MLALVIATVRNIVDVISTVCYNFIAGQQGPLRTGRGSGSGGVPYLKRGASFRLAFAGFWGLSFRVRGRGFRARRAAWSQLVFVQSDLFRWFFLLLVLAFMVFYDERV